MTKKKKCFLYFKYFKRNKLNNSKKGNNKIIHQTEEIEIKNARKKFAVADTRLIAVSRKDNALLIQ